MNNSPKSLGAISAYRASTYTIRLNMYEGFTLSTDPVLEIYNGSRKIQDVEGTYNAGTRQVEIILLPELIAKLPPIAESLIKLDDNRPLSVSIKPTWEAADDDIVAYNVTMSGDTYLVVEILGMEAVTGQVAIATSAAEQAALDRGQTGQDRTAVASDKEAVAADKSTVAADKAIVATDKADTMAAKQITESARDETIQLKEDVIAILAAQIVQTYKVDTKAEAEAFAATLTDVTKIIVMEDESNDGDTIEYLWNGTSFGVLGEYLIL